MQQIIAQAESSGYEILAYFDTRDFDIAFRALVLLKQGEVFSLHNASPETGGIAKPPIELTTKRRTAIEQFSVRCLRSI